MPASTRSTSVILQASRAQETLVRFLVTAAVIAGFAVVLANYGPDFSNVWRYRSTYIKGLGVTLLVGFLAYALALVLGLVVATARLSRRVWARHLADLYVELVRGTPLLAQIMIWRYGVAVMLGIHSKIAVGVLSLAVFAAAYIGEIIRAGIQSVDRGQLEAARSLGLSRWQTLRTVVLPQALRRMIPPLTSELINVVKDSSLLMVIGVGELMWSARAAGAASYDYFEGFLLAAAAYLVVTFSLSMFTRHLERRLGRSERQGVHL